MIQMRLVPLPGEALHGFLFRLSQAYGLQNSRQLLRAASLKPAVSYDDAKLLAIAHTFELNLSVLRAMSPTTEATLPILNLRHQRSAFSPICPKCVGDEEFVRSAWDHELVTACPEHGILLLDSCPGCGQLITRDRESLSHCQHCNFDLVEAATEPAADFDLALSAFLAGTEHASRGALPSAWHVGSPPPDLAAFLYFLAAYIQPSGQKKKRTGKAPRPKTVQESRALLQQAWSALKEWPQGLHAFVEKRISNGAGRSVHERLGPWLAVFQKEFDGTGYSFFAEAVEHVLLERFDGHLERFRRRKQSFLTKEKGWYSAAEAASLLNSTASLVIAAVETGQLQGRMELQGSIRYVSVHRDVIEGVRQARSQHLTQTDVRKRLGITKLMLQRLVEVGALQELSKADLPPLVSGSFRLVDVDALVCRLKRAVQAKKVPTQYTMGLQDISMKCGFLHADIMSSLQDINQGLIRPVEVVPGAIGLAALRFDVREIRARLATQSTEPMLRISELVAYARWKRDDIKQWIQGGFLRVHREQHGSRLVERVPLSALIEFMTQYIVLADVSEAFETTTNDLLRTLKPAKIQPAVSTRTGVRPARGLLVEKLAVIRGAQLRKPTIRDLAEQLESCEC
jgi:TniQ